ncbi:MAG: Sulfite exporter TauE/SafE [Pelotomaculum sp. PtaB.Bin104]|nr:MAG: Sulfite exporter TauE/SafE [Pelotomaculum sp. PtaB.Bin104]
MVKFLIGLSAGIFSGLVGIGGGVLLIPFMTGILKMQQHQAGGTSLVVIICTGIVGAVTYAWRGSVDLGASVLLASAAILTARAGVYYAHTLPAWKLKRYFGAFMLLVTVLLFMKPYLFQISSLAYGWIKIFALLSTGAIAGFLSGMLGIGGGVIMVPAMALLTGLTQQTAQGSSLLAFVPIGLTGALAHWRLGNINTAILPALIAGALIGSYLGASLANYLAESALRVIFSAVLLWTGVKYLRAPADKAGYEEEKHTIVLAKLDNERNN